MANYKCPPQNRNFSDNLVGLQLTDGGGLTLGTFEFSTVITEKVTRDFETGNYSTLFNNSDLDLNPTFAASIYNNNFRLYPNFDETDLSNFVSYGSLSKRLEVAVNNILNYFPAVLEITQVQQQVPIQLLTLIMMLMRMKLYLQYLGV